MARPRVFVSSTFYDLRQIREDLRLFIEQMGYEPVLHEAGDIPYGRSEPLEEYCYQEIEQSDIVVSVVGDRFGSTSRHEPYSVSQRELKQALECGKQVYVFVLRGVHEGYPWYVINKDVEGIRWPFTNADKVFAFLSELHALPNNNQIVPFETSQDITRHLREQWAGLFHTFLQQQERYREVQLTSELQATAKTLNQLVTYVTERTRDQGDVIQDILLSNHPIFERIKSATKTPYRVFFSTHDEMLAWLTARQYQFEPEPESRYTPEGEPYIVEIWRHTRDDHRVEIFTDLFDEQRRLRVYTQSDWRDYWVERVELEDEEIPF